MRRSSVLLAAAIWAAGAAAGAAGAGPERVVSTNLCTDQLALLLARPGQLVSVSTLAQDPDLSALSDAAMAVPANSGGAEEVFELRPDLVVAGTYTTPTTSALLRRLGVGVETFPPARSIAAFRDDVTRMGRLLGREARADEVLAAFDAALDLVRAAPSDDAPTAVIFEAQGFSPGADSLAASLLQAAGLRDIDRRRSGGFLPLEILVLARPDLLVTGREHSGAARGEELLDHPAIVGTGARRTAMNGRWICATPDLVAEIARLRDLADGLGAGE